MRIRFVAIMLIVISLMCGCAENLLGNETEMGTQTAVKETEPKIETTEAVSETETAGLTMEEIEKIIGKDYVITENAFCFDFDEIRESGYYLDGGILSEALGIAEGKLYCTGVKVNDNGQYSYYICVAELSNAGGEMDILCEVEEFEFRYFSDMIGNYLFFLDGETTASSVISTLYRCDLQGNLEIIWNGETVYAPIVYAVGDKLVMNLSYEDRCEMYLYDTNTGVKTNICTTNVEYMTDGRMNGEFIIYGGGIDDSGFAYGVLKLDHEFVNEANVSDIIYYDILSEKSECVITPERRSHYLYGDNRVVFRCEYSYEKPMKNPFVIYDRLTGEETRIEDSGLHAGANVVGVVSVGAGKYLARTPEHLYLINVNTKEIEKIFFEFTNAPESKVYIEWIDGSGDSLLAFYYEGQYALMEFERLGSTR